WVRMVQSGVTRVFGDPNAGEAYAEEAERLLRERCAGVLFELGCAAHLRMTACTPVGHFAPAADLTALIDDAWRRGDLFTATMLTGSSAIGRLVQGDADGVERHLERARKHWQRPREYSVPDYHLLEASALHSRYTSVPSRGLESIRAAWPGLVTS